MEQSGGAQPSDHIPPEQETLPRAKRDTGARALFVGYGILPAPVGGSVCAKIFGPRCEVTAPVAPGVADPTSGGCDVQAEEVREYGSGQVGGKPQQCGVTGAARFDSVLEQTAAQCACGLMPAGAEPGEEPSRARETAAQGGARRHVRRQAQNLGQASR